MHVYASKHADGRSCTTYVIAQNPLLLKRVDHSYAMSAPINADQDGQSSRLSHPTTGWGHCKITSIPQGRTGKAPSVGPCLAVTWQSKAGTDCSGVLLLLLLAAAKAIAGVKSPLFVVHSPHFPIFPYPWIVTTAVVSVPDDDGSRQASGWFPLPLIRCCPRWSVSSSA